MRIYPETTYEKQGGVLLVKRHTPGLERIDVYQLVATIEDRTDCYCCTCGEMGHDAFCRNHGFAGQRPCDIHDMPGQADDDGEMPEPVSVARGRN